MIPLNKPFSASFKNNTPDSAVDFDVFKQEHFNNYYSNWTYSSRNGLDLIYKQLFKDRGSLNVGVSPLTCFEALYPIISNNHKIVFIDIDRETFNLDEKLLINYSDLDAIQPIHLGGNPQRMDIISKWAKKNSVLIIEDCAQALGSYYLEQHVGSFGDYAVFSLVKNLHLSIGSVIFSRSEIKFSSAQTVPYSIILYKNIKRFFESRCTHKKTNFYNLFYRQLLLIKNEGQQYYNSHNYALTLNLIHESRERFRFYETMNHKRNEITAMIIKETNENNFLVQKVPDGGYSNRNRLLFTARKAPAIQVINFLRKKGIAANNLTQNYLKGFQEPVNDNNILKSYFDKTKLGTYMNIHPFLFSVPNSPALNEKEMTCIIKSLNDF